MRLTSVAIAAAACLIAAAPAAAAGPAGSITQLPGSAGCITEDGTSNGSVGQCADGRGLETAEPIVVSPDGRFVYTYSYGTGQIAILARDPATGALTQADDISGCVSWNTFGGLCTDAPFPRGAGDDGHSLAISPDGTFLFAAGELTTGYGVSAFRRDTTTGALTPVAGGGGCISTDGKDADGANTCTGFTLLGAPTALAVSPDGRFLYAGGTDATIGLVILTVDPTFGLGLLPTPDSCFAAVTTPGCTPARYAAKSLDVALSPDARTLYAINRDGAVLGYARDAGSGKLTPLAGTHGCVYQGGPGPISAEPCVTGHGLTGVQGLTVSPDGTLVAAGTHPAEGGGIAVLRRDPATGSLSQSGGAAGCVNIGGVDDCGASRITRAVYTTVFAPDGRELFAAVYGGANADESGISLFDVAADGTLTQRAGAGGCYTETGGECTAARGVRGAVGVTLSPDARFLYATDYTPGGVAAFVREVAPSCSDASASTAFGAAVAIPVACGDGNGDAVTLAGVDGPAHGTVTFNGLSATYAPAAGFSGTDSFRVRGNDGVNDSAPATVSVTVGAPPPSGKGTPVKLSLGAKPKRDRRLPFKFTFSGKLTPAAGATCSGKVVLTVKRGKKTVAKRTAKLSPSCAWKARVTFRNRKKLGRKRSGKLTAKARYTGNTAMTTKTSKTVTVRFG